MKEEHKLVWMYIGIMLAIFALLEAVGLFKMYILS